MRGCALPVIGVTSPGHTTGIGAAQHRGILHSVAPGKVPAACQVGVIDPGAVWGDFLEGAIGSAFVKLGVLGPAAVHGHVSTVSLISRMPLIRNHTNSEAMPTKANHSRPPPPT